MSIQPQHSPVANRPRVSPLVQGAQAASRTLVMPLGAPQTLTNVAVWRQVGPETKSRPIASAGGAPWWFRFIECLVAVPMLVLTFPLMLMIAAIIWFDSPGPVLFRQWRVGQGGKLFRFTKFRTLYVDARQRWPELYAYQYTPRQLEQLYFKVPDDPRVTRVGQWLRKSTLDELPNLWHVLKGDMALVGPRPEIPEMLPYYNERGLKKFSVRPGVTGLAQVSGRGNLSFFDTVAFDLEYVERRSVLLDISILVRTAYRTVRRDGAF